MALAHGASSSDRDVVENERPKREPAPRVSMRMEGRVSGSA